MLVLSAKWRMNAYILQRHHLFPLSSLMLSLLVFKTSAGIVIILVAHFWLLFTTAPKQGPPQAEGQVRHQHQSFLKPTKLLLIQGPKELKRSTLQSWDCQVGKRRDSRRQRNGFVKIAYVDCACGNDFWTGQSVTARQELQGSRSTSIIHSSSSSSSSSSTAFVRHRVHLVQNIYADCFIGYTVSCPGLNMLFSQIHPRRWCDTRAKKSPTKSLHCWSLTEHHRIGDALFHCTLHSVGSFY